MKDDGKKGRALLRAKLSLLFGGMGLMITWLYARNLYKPLIEVGGNHRRFSFIRTFFEIDGMVKYESLGGVIAVVSLLLLIYGFIQMKKSGWKPEHSTGRYSVRRLRMLIATAA